MKKLFFVLALVAVYAVSVSNVYASVNVASKAGVSVVADDKVSKDDPKKSEAKKEAACAEKKVAGCCAAKAEADAKGCAEAKKTGACAKTCGGDKEAVPAKK